MKILKNITNGVLLIVIGIMHTQFALSSNAFGKQFHEFSQSYFFKIHDGLKAIPFVGNYPKLEVFAAFWFFYFGILLIPIGLLLHSLEKSGRILPHSFTISYLVVVLIGSYMIPSSGMTFFMLPHAIYMLVSNYVKAKARIALPDKK
jgi:hypothetical protein